jgi:hypothetical protein
VIAQIEYCRNFIFKRHFASHKLFERISDRTEHGHCVFRAYFKHALLKQYEKFSTFLRNELSPTTSPIFHIKKGLDHLEAVRQRFQTITACFAGLQAQWLNVHVDFPLLQRLALPITVGAFRYPGIKIHDPSLIRLLEVLLHGGSHLGGWTAKQVHHAVLTSFHRSESIYGLNQVRYDLREFKGHGLLQRDGSRYAYRLTPKGVHVALLFFKKRLCGPLTFVSNRPASSKPRTTAPTKPFNKSSTCSPPHYLPNSSTLLVCDPPG